MEHPTNERAHPRQQPTTDRFAGAREELIENLAQLVVRQHRRLQRSDSIPLNKAIGLPKSVDNDASHDDG